MEQSRSLSTHPRSATRCPSLQVYCLSYNNKCHFGPIRLSSINLSHNILKYLRFGRVSVESMRITSYGAVDEQQLRSLESWLEVALETSARVDQQQRDGDEEDCGPRYSPIRITG